MIKIVLVYNNETLDLKCKLEKYLLDNSFEFISYNDDYYKTRKKAIATKVSFGSRKTPFCVLYNDDTAIKAFYEEIGECNLDNILNIINKIIKNESTGN